MQTGPMGHHALLVRERALRDRFMQWCDGSVTFDDVTGSPPSRTSQVASYDEVLTMIRRLRSRRGGPVWRLQVSEQRVEFNGMLANLNIWARSAGLLRGRRARHVEQIWCELRNFVSRVPED